MRRRILPEVGIRKWERPAPSDPQSARRPERASDVAYQPSKNAFLNLSAGVLRGGHDNHVSKIDYDAVDRISEYEQGFSLRISGISPRGFKNELSSKVISDHSRNCTVYLTIGVDRRRRNSLGIVATLTTQRIANAYQDKHSGRIQRFRKEGLICFSLDVEPFHIPARKMQALLGQYCGCPHSDTMPGRGIMVRIDIEFATCNDYKYMMNDIDTATSVGHWATASSLSANFRLHQSTSTDALQLTLYGGREHQKMDAHVLQVIISKSVPGRNHDNDKRSSHQSDSLQQSWSIRTSSVSQSLEVERVQRAEIRWSDSISPILEENSAKIGVNPFPSYKELLALRSSDGPAVSTRPSVPDQPSDSTTYDLIESLPKIFTCKASSPSNVTKRKWTVPDPPPGVIFYRTCSRRHMEPGELVSDSDDGVDEEVLMSEHDALNKRELTDLSTDKKELVRRLNTYFWHNRVLVDACHSSAIASFIESNIGWLSNSPDRFEAVGRVCDKLRSWGTISAADLDGIKQTLHYAERTAKRTTENALPAKIFNVSVGPDFKDRLPDWPFVEW